MAIASATLAIVAVVASIASAAASAVSAHQQGQMQKKAANYNAKVAENNALSASFQAQYEADRIRERNRRIAGKQRAGFAKSGISIVDGSAYDVQYDSQIQGELDALASFYRGNVASTGYRGEASYMRASGAAAARAGNMAAGTSLLSGAASAAANYGSITQRKHAADMIV